MSNEYEFRNELIEKDFYINELEKMWRSQRLTPNAYFLGLKNPILSSELIENLDNQIKDLNLKLKQDIFKTKIFKELYKDFVNNQISIIEKNKRFLIALNRYSDKNMINDDDIKEIKQIPMIDVIKYFNIDVINSKPEKCLCPFHSEKTPSLAIYDNSFFCFGCQAGGDVIEFYQKMSNCSFVEAVKELKGFI